MDREGEVRLRKIWIDCWRGCFVVSGQVLWSVLLEQGKLFVLFVFCATLVVFALVLFQAVPPVWSSPRSRGAVLCSRRGFLH
jgi:hypothetical protein